jgi:hypothetical protein
MIRKLIFILVASTLLVACGGVDKYRLDQLEQAIVRYAQALRWGRYEDAQEYHLTRDGERSKIDKEAMRHIRITGYQIHEKTMNDDLMEAEVTGVMDYFNDDRGTVRQVPLRQTWWFEPSSKRWFVSGELPEFR